MNEQEERRVCPMTLATGQPEFCIRGRCQAWDEVERDCRLLRVRARARVMMAGNDGEWIYPYVRRG
jgi:hypothetical protein